MQKDGLQGHVFLCVWGGHARAAGRSMGRVPAGLLPPPRMRAAASTTHLGRFLPALFPFAYFSQHPPGAS